MSGLLSLPCANCAPKRYLTGVPLEHTICTIAVEAVRRGIAVYIITDGVTSADMQRADRTKELLVKEGISFVSSQHL